MHRSLTRPERLLIGLLVASIFLNYMDRANLSVAAPVLEKELALTPLQIGSLLSAFFWSYALLQLLGVAGWITDRYPVSRVLCGGFLVWSAATLATGFLSSFGWLFCARLVLGAGESLAYPCYSRILATDIPQEHRGLSNALIDAGSKLGPALGTFVGGFMIARIGWRGFFFALGAGSLIWLAPWLRNMPRTGRAKASSSEPSPSLLDVLTLRPAWGAFLGHFCGNYFWFFLLTWLPSYLVKERRFSLTRMGNISSTAFLLMALATICAGWLSDRAIAGGASPTRVRKTVVVTGLLASTIILPLTFVKSERWAIFFLLLACIAFGTYTSNHWAITQTLAGPIMAGRWTSLQNGIGNLSGIAAAWLTGLVVDRTGSFHLAFGVAAVVVFAAALFWGLVVGPVRPVTWRSPATVEVTPETK